MVEEKFHCRQRFTCFLGEIEAFFELNLCEQACFWKVVDEKIFNTLTRCLLTFQLTGIPLPHTSVSKETKTKKSKKKSKNSSSLCGGLP